MNTRRFSIHMALAVALFAMLACSVTNLNLNLNTTPIISNIRLSTDATGKTTTTAYSPNQQFFIFADLSNIKVGSQIEARWYAVNVTGADPNKLINTSDYSYESGVPSVYFKLSTTDGNNWPAGTYKVEMYLDGTKVGEETFPVQ